MGKADNPYLQAMANDYQLVDGTETVTYTANRAAGSTAFAVNFADWRAVTLREVVSGDGFWQAGDRKWLLGANQFPAGTTPQRGDSLAQADGTVWELQEGSALDDFNICWDCPATKKR